MVCNLQFLLGMNFNPEMAVDGCPSDSLMRVLTVVCINLEEEIIEVALYHFIKRKRIWLSFLPSINIDGKNHSNCWSKQNRSKVVYCYRAVNRRECQQYNSNESDECGETDIKDHFLRSLLPIDNLFLTVCSCSYSGADKNYGIEFFFGDEAGQVLFIITMIQEPSSFFVTRYNNHFLAVLWKKHHIHQLRAIEQTHLGHLPAFILGSVSNGILLLFRFTVRLITQILFVNILIRTLLF